MSGNKKTDKNITSGFFKILKNRNILVFLVFFAIASFLWFLNAINKEYTSEIDLGISFKNLPSTMSQIEDSDYKLSISVSGHGYNLLREEIEKVKLPLVIDFGDKNNIIKLHHNTENCTQSYILTSDIKEMVSKRFGDNIKVVKISPDTIFFNVQQTYSRKLPVIPQVNYEVDINYMQHGEIIVKPDSITVFGPKSFIDSLNSVYTIKKQLGTIGENHITELEISFLKNLRYSRTNVLIDIPLEKYTETQIEKEIIPINVPKNSELNLIPEKVQIFYKIPLSIYENISELDFSAIVDYNNEQNQEIEISVSTNNEDIKITSISPISVKYLLEEKEDSDD